MLKPPSRLFATNQKSASFQVRIKPISMPSAKTIVNAAPVLPMFNHRCCHISSLVAPGGTWTLLIGSAQAVNSPGFDGKEIGELLLTQHRLGGMVGV
jgi:hypothetical protein